MNASTLVSKSDGRPRRLVRFLRAAISGMIVFATAIALFYAEENWRAERAWRAHKDKMAALGESLELDHFAPAPVPADRNFAQTSVLDALAWHTRETWPAGLAQLLDAGLAAGPEYGQEGKWAMDWTKWLAGLPATIRPEVSAAGLSPSATALVVLRPLEPVVAELRLAARTRPLGQFSPPEIKDGRYTTSSVDSLFGLSRLLGVYAAAELAEGQVEQAFEDSVAIHRLAVAIEASGSLLDVLVRNAIVNGIEKPIFADGWCRQCWTPAQYESFQKRFVESNGPAAFNRGLRWERAMTNRYYGFSPAPFKWTEFGRGLNFWLAVMPRGWWRQNLIVADDAMQQALANGFDETPPHYRRTEVTRLATLIGDLRQRRSPFSLVASVAMPKFNLSADIASKADSELMAGVVCALERYRAEQGAYPESLDALVPRFMATLPTDVYTAQPFRYRRTADGKFPLYSVGSDEKDDGGAAGDDWAWPRRADRNVR